MSYYVLLTDIGQAQIANAVALGQQVKLTHIAVGDANGKTPQPNKACKALEHECHRAAINRVEIDHDNPNWIVLEQVLPPNIGGWEIREVGAFDAEGNLIAYGNYPPTYKPLLNEGTSRTQTLRIVMQVSDTAAVTLKVDPSVVLATRKYVDDGDAKQATALAEAIATHEKSRNHPEADTANKGVVRLATTEEATSGKNNDVVMTPATSKVVIDSLRLGDAAHKGVFDDSNPDNIPWGSAAVASTGTVAGLRSKLKTVATSGNYDDLINKPDLREAASYKVFPNVAGKDIASWTDVLATCKQVQEVRDDISKMLSEFKSGFDNDLSLRGWQRIAGGMILQWGWEAGWKAGAREDNRVNYPIAFPNKAFAVFANMASPGNYGYDGLKTFTEWSNSNFLVRKETANSYPFDFYWFAIGY